jgi:damage-control phosphatase, subfamily I
MKASISCAPCIVGRSLQKARLATKDEGKRFEFMRRAFKHLSEWFGPDSVPSFYTLKENRMLIEVTGNRDPYRAKKAHVIGKAKECLPVFRRFVQSAKNPRERFMRALKVSLCGNMIEISAPQHKVDVLSLEKEVMGCVKKRLPIDDSGRIFEAAKKAGSIVFLCDNCGEAVLDGLLLEELAKFGELTIAVSTEPIEDDVCLKEAKRIGLRKYGRVVGKGGASQGVSREENSKEFFRLMESADLIVAKGMSCYETLTEYPEVSRGKIAFLFTVKCGTVSERVGANVGCGVAMLY